MKFTEEQYQKIVSVAKIYSEKSGWGIIGELESPSIGKELWHAGFGGECNFDEQAEKILAIINPLTREWAHKRFVEKEKKFMWRSKKANATGDHKILYKSHDGETVKDLMSSLSERERHVNVSEELTESEIRAWGYNSDMFDREEVQ